MTMNKEAFEKWYKEEYNTDELPCGISMVAWQAATEEANKRMAELESELTDTRNAYHESRTEFYAMQATNHDLREVLENVLSWVVYQPVACHGMKCRESVCESCCGEEAAEIASKQAREAVSIARKTLSATPAESLQAFENEVIEKCAKVCDDQATEWDSDSQITHLNYAEHCAMVIRSLKVYVNE